jgi:hypothetical protein
MAATDFYTPNISDKTTKTTNLKPPRPAPVLTVDDEDDYEENQVDLRPQQNFGNAERIERPRTIDPQK